MEFDSIISGLEMERENTEDEAPYAILSVGIALVQAIQIAVEQQRERRAEQSKPKP